MQRLTSRSAFPFKTELAIGIAIWLTYAAPSAVLFFHPTKPVANICWAVVAGATIFLVLPVIWRLGFSRPPEDPNIWPT